MGLLVEFVSWFGMWQFFMCLFVAFDEYCKYSGQPPAQHLLKSKIYAMKQDGAI
jgi:hypothetical protein